jgi:hypothetical protein
MTLIFPDATLPGPTSGGFANQEEFRKFCMSLQDGRWHSEMHARPHCDHAADYKDDTIAEASPF